MLLYLSFQKRLLFPCTVEEHSCVNSAEYFAAMCRAIFEGFSSTVVARQCLNYKQDKTHSFLQKQTLTSCFSVDMAWLVHVVKACQLREQDFRDMDQSSPLKASTRPDLNQLQTVSLLFTFFSLLYTLRYTTSRVSNTNLRLWIRRENITP